jgi:hypothetical protein
MSEGGKRGREGSMAGIDLTCDIILYVHQRRNKGEID